MSGVEIEVRDLCKSWKESRAVDGISFTAPAGQFTVLLGPSGCGKSTTLRLIAGLEDATSGQILIDGRDVTQRPPSDRQIAMVFQSYALFPHLSVAENILFGLKVRKVPAGEQATRLERTAALLGLSELLERRPNQLSGGQQQRVALGRAIIAEKPICLMDEPLSNLDAKLRHEMRIELRALQRTLGLTMVYVTHDQAEAISMADKIVVLNRGRIEQSATPRELYERPASLFAARFIGTPPMNIVRLAKEPAGWSIAGDSTPLVTVLDESGLNESGLGESRLVEPGAVALFLGLRPEDLSICETGGLPAVVESVEYLGSDHLVDCRIGSERITARFQHRRSVSVGETLRLTWGQGAARLYSGDAGQRSTGRLLDEASWRRCGPDIST
jgi:sn-glycerol 3-phosphate transport system ATP-binding protein